MIRRSPRRLCRCRDGASVSTAATQAATQAAPSSPPPSLAPGDTVIPFDAVGVDGVSRHVDFPKGSHTVVMFFLSSCPVCHKMLPVWTEYYQRKPKTLNVVGVMLDSPPPGFFSAMPIGFRSARPAWSCTARTGVQRPADRARGSGRWKRRGVSMPPSSPEPT
jgi:thiol-disulfide isomerase/thioredoxin